MNVTLRGIRIDFNADRENGLDWIRFSCESDSKEIDETDAHEEKFSGPRVSIVRGITIDEADPRYRTIVVFARFNKKPGSTEKAGFSISIEIEKFSRPENAEPSMNATLRAMTIDFKEENEKAFDSIRFSCETDSNEIDEMDKFDEKLAGPRVSTVRGITIDEADPRYRTIVVFVRFIKKEYSIENAGFPVSIEIEKLCRIENVEPSMNVTLAE
jgi:hypothetical protein